MGIREIALGKTGGKTGWQHLKDRWAASRAEDKWQREFPKAYNPLGIKPGDLVDIGLTDEQSYEVDTVIWYHTPDGLPDIVRYGLQPLIGDGTPRLLEVMPGDGPGELLHSLFEGTEDMLLDDDIVAQLEADAMDYDFEDGPVEVEKDFETESTVMAFGKEFALTELAAFTYSFFAVHDENLYLSVDALDEPHNTASIYVGRSIDPAQLTIHGIAQPTGL